MQAVEQPEAPMEVGTDEVASESVPSCVRSCDGLELKVGEDVFFERHEDGILEPGVVVDILKEGNDYIAVVRYKDSTWGKFAGYNERKDVNTLMVMGQLVSKTRTRRPPRPVARFEPPQLEIKPKKSRDAAELERRKQQRRRKKRKDEKKRRALKKRLRELKAKVFSEAEMSLERLTEGEFAELMARVGSSDHEAILDFLTSEPMSSDGESALGYSSSGSSSSFPESDISSMSEDSSESDGSISDVSTNSCPSEPDFKYWKSVRDPTKREMKYVGYDRFRICPKYTSSDSEESDEESLEMGLTPAIVSWTHRERAAMLSELLGRQESLERRQKTGAMSYQEWCLALHLIGEDVGGLNHLESCSAIKGVKRCEGMRTMYGAIRAPLIREMIRFMSVTKDDKFIDIGSGLGTVVLQMAATTGCQATGIELEQSRFNLSAMLNEELISTLQEMKLEQTFVEQLKGRIEMINGDVRMYEEKILKSTAIYFNNHGIWFDETSSKQGEISVEHWVAKLFAKTAVGTRLVILKSIPHLKGDWFREEVYIARSDWLTWARDEKPLYCYTKLKDTWKCEKCGHENDIVRDYQYIWEMKCDNNCPSRATTLRTKAVPQD